MSIVLCLRIQQLVLTNHSLVPYVFVVQLETLLLQLRHGTHALVLLEVNLFTLTDLTSLRLHAKLLTMM